MSRADCACLKKPTRLIHSCGSAFGNTAEIPQAIAASLGQRHQVTAVRVEEASQEDLQNFDVLFVGSPTFGFAPSEKIAAFLKQIPLNSLAGLNAAVFDTRIPLENLRPAFLRFMLKRAGYADVKIAAMLKLTGARLLQPTGGFHVAASEGPLKEGERERAAVWAESLLPDQAGSRPVA